MRDFYFLFSYSELTKSFPEMEEYKLYYAQVRILMFDVDIGPDIPDNFYAKQTQYRMGKTGNIS